MVVFDGFTLSLESEGVENWQEHANIITAMQPQKYAEYWLVVKHRD